MTRALLAIALLTLPARTGNAQPEIVSKIDEFVRREMERQRVPGVAVAMIRGGDVVVAKGYGLANLEHQVPADPQTLFQSGSVGKQFTAAAVMLLVEAGKLRLDESVTTYLPEAPAEWKPITIRHLLTHTSGIPEYTTDDFDYRRDYSEDEIARMAYALKLEFPAGSRWNYSNTGYALLGIIIRRASGKFYGDLLHEQVFAPLGMTTARVISEEDVIPNRAAGYRLVDEQVKNQEWVAPQLNTTADGSLYLSLQDFIAWDHGIRSKAVLSAQSWEQIFEPVKLNSGRAWPYGFGWVIDEVAGQTAHSHGGSWQGFRASVARYLGDDLTLVVLANLAEAKTWLLLEGLAALENPALKPEDEAIADDQPAVTRRLRDLLAAAAAGHLNPDEFAYVRAGFFPTVTEEYQELLRDLGDPNTIELLERRDLGDDRFQRYRVSYAKKTLFATLRIVPDGRISEFAVWSE